MPKQIIGQVPLVPVSSWFAPERLGQLDYFYQPRFYPRLNLMRRYENLAPGNQLPGLVVQNVAWHIASVPNRVAVHGQMVTNNFRPPSLTQYGTYTTELNQVSSSSPVIPASMLL